MAGSSIGNILKLTTWGESHGPALGAVLDGFPAGIELEESDIQVYLDRRKPGHTSIATPRKEADQVEILSGVFEGRTTGTPISLMIRNTSQHSQDYGNLADCYRPGHADYGFDAKFGFRDYRGGGRSSGRETAGRVAGGAIAAKLLRQMGIEIMAYTKSIGPVAIDPARFDKSLILTTPTAMPDAQADAEATEYLHRCMMEKDSSGGVIECRITGVPAGIGDPVFHKLDARFGQALLSIGAVKAVEIGDGTAVGGARGSQNNDPFALDGQGGIGKKTNHAGGILGGISDGSEIVLRAYVKPTASIFQEQDTVNRQGEAVKLTIKGRHDPVIVPRAVVVVESMCALTLLDAMLLNMSARAENVIDFYR
ncbi:MAG: chorismate synthase [Eubacteriales bacterium]|nr:chorismate synthase [Eubacteriales bacterium]